MIRSVCTSLLATCVLLTACGDDRQDTPAGTRYIERGDFGAGYQIHTTSGGLEIKAWYPTSGGQSSPIEYAVSLKWPGFPADQVSIMGAATPNAPFADRGPFPLVVFSHGFAINPEWYRTVAEHLATHGFVVLAPEHQESDWQPDILAATVTRPKDVTSTIDFAETGPLSPYIDTSRVAVAGHSYGGYTALASAGAQFDLDDLEQRCRSVGDDSFEKQSFCNPFLVGKAELAAKMGLESPPTGLWPQQADARVKAIVAMAGDAYLFGERGHAGVNVPVMMLGGTADTGTPWDWGSGLSYESVSSDHRFLVGFVDAEHFMPVASCDDMPFMAGFPDALRNYICTDPAWAKQEGLDLVHHLTTAFLFHSLNNDKRATQSLDPKHYDAFEDLDVSFTN